MDKTAFEALYLQQLPGLYRLAQGILRHPADAQDAVQQAVLQAWKHLDTLQSGKEKAYLARIVINECRNIQRLRKRLVPTAEWEDHAQAETDTGELREAVEALPEKLRLPLLLVYMEGYRAKDAALVLGITVFALKSRLKRAKKALKMTLEEEGEA